MISSYRSKHQNECRLYEKGPDRVGLSETRTSLHVDYLQPIMIIILLLFKKGTSSFKVFESSGKLRTFKGQVSTTCYRTNHPSKNDHHVPVSYEEACSKDENTKRECAKQRRNHRPADSSQRHDYVQQ